MGQFVELSIHGIYMLQLGGYMNILIAVGHIVGLLWADQMFEATGIKEVMDGHAAIHPALPYLWTVFVAIVFFIFGLYGLSAAGQFRKLPLLKLGVFSVAGIYLLRGVGELIFGIPQQQANPVAETVYSLIAVAIGLLFLIGGLNKWVLKKA